MDKQYSMVLGEAELASLGRLLSWHLHYMVDSSVCNIICLSDSDGDREGEPGSGDTMEDEDGV